MDNWFKLHISGPAICFLGRRKETRSFTKAPILIGGCGRSGTSLLLSILSAHPAIFALPVETDAFTRWEYRQDQLHPVRLDRFYRELLMRKVPRSCHRWCEKRPYNVRYIRELLEYFGSEMRFIHLVRDPRAVCTSMHPEKPETYWIDPERYIRDVEAGLRFQHHPQVLTLTYERLVSDTPAILKKLCSFLEEEPTTEWEGWYEHATVRTHRAWFHQLREVHEESLTKWQAPEHTERIQKLLANAGIRDLMNRQGYN